MPARATVGGASELLGLTSAEVARRRHQYGPNQLPAPPEPSVVALAARQLAEPLSILLVVAAGVSGFGLGEWVEAAAIAAIVTLNVVIGTVQEARAGTAIAALARLTAPTSRVHRDGQTVVVPAGDLVPGDVIELDAGDRVPADVELLEATAFAVDEALLTGESQPVDKRAGAWTDPQPGLVARPTVALAGTLVVRGRAVGGVRRTGAATEVGAIAVALGRPAEPPLVTELRGVATWMSGVAIVFGALLVPIVYARGDHDGDAAFDAVLAGVALAVAALPEGLPTIVTTALALGAREMATHGAIVRRLPAIEALGAATVICSDKTGTLTTGQLAVAEVVPAPGRTQQLWDAALRCNDARGDVGDPVDVALGRAAAALGHPAPDGTRLAERPFDVVTRSMTTCHAGPAGPIVSVKGAPEVVLGRCHAGPARDDMERAIPALTGRGLRVLAFAAADTADLDATDLEPLGLIGFEDPLRPSAVDTVAACRRAGIRVVMVTGDHLDTARNVARAAGLDAGSSITGTELAELDDTARAAALRSANVIARVDPHMKVDLVDAYRAAGDVVAMTGDGVNDAPALSRADIGVALAGEMGTDVAREAAEIVVTNGDLGTIAGAVREGRRIYRNLMTVVAYLLTGNVSEVLVVVGSLLVFPELAVPLLPVQLLWLNLVTDGLPALALGIDRAPADPLDGPPRRRDEALLSRQRVLVLVARALAIAIPVLVSGVIAHRAGWDSGEVRTQLLLSLLCAHLLLAYASRAQRWTFERGWWRNAGLLAAVAGSLLLQVPAFATSVGRSVLGLEPLPTGGWAMAAVSALVAVFTIDLARMLARHGADARPIRAAREF